MIHPTAQLTTNITLLMQRKGVTNVTELAKNTRIPQPTLHRLMAGDIKEPKYALLKRIADYFKIKVEELMEKDLIATTSECNVEGSPESLHFTKVPVVGGAQLGTEGHWVNLQYPVGYGDGYISWPTKDPDAYALRCSGDSMKPRIKDGEYVVIEPNHNYLPGDEVLVITRDEQVMVKTFLYKRDAEVMVMSINEEHLPIRFAVKEIESIQYVAGIAKQSLYTGD